MKLFKRSWWKLAVLLLAAAVAVMVVISINSDPEGEGGGVSFHGGSFKANNNTMRTSSVSSTDHNLFLVRRIAVICESEHPVLKRATRKLAAALQEFPFVEEVVVFSDERPAAGETLYDLYVMIEMPTFESRGLLAMGRKVTAEIKCVIGRGFWNSRHAYTDHLSPALVNPRIEITLEHESVARGVETPNIRFHKVGEDISTQLIEQVTEPLVELAGKFAPPTNLPAGLYPPYHPRPELPAPWNERLVEMINGPGFMLHNQTILTMRSTRPYEDLKTTRDMLAERGWRMDSKAFDRQDEGGLYYYRATLGNLISEAFEARDHGPREPNEEVRLVFRYYDRMTQDEIETVFSQAYGDDIPSDLWLPFKHLLPEDMNARVLEKYVTSSHLAPAVEKEVIRHLDKTGRGEAARHRLRVAYLSASLEGDEPAKEMLKLGREIMEDKEWKPANPTPADLRALNIPRAEPGASFEREVALSEPARFHVGPTNRLNILTITVKPADIPEGRFSLECSNYELGKGSRGASSVTPHGTNKPWSSSMPHTCVGAGWVVQAEELGDERFRLIIKGEG